MISLLLRKMKTGIEIFNDDLMNFTSNLETGTMWTSDIILLKDRNRQNCRFSQEICMKKAVN